MILRFGATGMQGREGGRSSRKNTICQRLFLCPLFGVAPYSFCCGVCSRHIRLVSRKGREGSPRLMSLVHVKDVPCLLLNHLSFVTSMSHCCCGFFALFDRIFPAGGREASLSAARRDHLALALPNSFFSRINIPIRVGAPCPVFPQLHSAQPVGRPDTPPLI